VLPGESLSKYRNRPVSAVPPLAFPPITRVEEAASLSSRFPEDEPAFAVTPGSEEVAKNSVEVEQPRTEASVRSLATAAYTQPSAVYEVEEEEEEPDYPAEEPDEDESGQDQEEGVEEESVEEEEYGELDDVIVTMPVVDGVDIRRPDVPTKPTAPQQAVTEQIEDDEEGYEETEVAEETESRDSFTLDSRRTEIVAENRSNLETSLTPRGHNLDEESTALAPLSFYSGSSAGGSRPTAHRWRPIRPGCRA